VKGKTRKELELELEETKLRLEEAEETLRAIRSGEVDALVVNGPDGERVYTLENENHTYRLFVESVNEGALTLTREGSIYYCNRRFSETVKAPIEKVIGSSLGDYVAPEDQEAYKTILEQSTSQVSKGEISLLSAEGDRLPVQLSINPLDLDGLFVSCAVLTDLTEQKRHQEVMTSYAEALELSNKDLRDFAFIASHDLQEPLRKIRTFGDMLLDELPGKTSDIARDYIERMQKAAARMQALLDSLLAYSRVTSKTNPFSRIDLREAARDALSNLEVQIEETGAKVEVQDLPFIEADKPQMIELFQNLLSNALKFHRDHEPPRVRVYAGPPPRKGMCQIHVEDNGIGFEEKYGDRIFLPFQRLHGKDQFPGLGMGLAISRKIVERHAGHIHAKSSPDKGSTFIITLPLGGEGHER
jgi:PAS domain S-box-containing protein